MFLPASMASWGRLDSSLWLGAMMDCVIVCARVFLVEVLCCLVIVSLSKSYMKNWKNSYDEFFPISTLPEALSGNPSFTLTSC
jgi:hypothetical protein